MPPSRPTREEQWPYPRKEWIRIPSKCGSWTYSESRSSAEGSSESPPGERLDSFASTSGPLRHARRQRRSRNWRGLEGLQVESAGRGHTRRDSARRGVRWDLAECIDRDPMQSPATKRRKPGVIFPLRRAEARCGSLRKRPKARCEFSPSRPEGPASARSSRGAGAREDLTARGTPRGPEKRLRRRARRASTRRRSRRLRRRVRRLKR